MTTFEFHNKWISCAKGIGDAMSTLTLVYDHLTKGFVTRQHPETSLGGGRPINKCNNCGVTHFNDFMPDAGENKFGASTAVLLWANSGLPFTTEMLEWGERLHTPASSSQKPTCPICYRMGNPTIESNQKCPERSHAAMGYARHRSLYCPKCSSMRIHGMTAKIGSRDRRRPQLGVFGSPTAKFPRPIGFEIETGSIGGSNNDSICQALASMGRQSCRCITNHHDGSLDAGGMEYVTPALLGEDVTGCLEAIYRELRIRKLSIEHILAGAHIHVDSRDIYRRFIQYYNVMFRKMYLAKEQGARIEIISRGRSDLETEYFAPFKEYFRKCLMVCRLFISERRRTNTYCRESFGIRNTQASWLTSTEYPGQNYCGIAIRTDTLEFRIWPSTNSLKNHIARAELSCKMVDFFAKAKVKDWQELAKRVPDGRKAIKSSANYSIAVLPWLKEIGVSDESIMELNKMADKYRNSKSDKTPTTVRELIMKEIPDPETLDKLCEAVKKDRTYVNRLQQHKTPEQVLAHPHTTFGDTMAWIPELGVYFDLETYEAVPNVGSGGYRYRM